MRHKLMPVTIRIDTDRHRLAEVVAFIKGPLFGSIAFLLEPPSFFLCQDCINIGAFRRFH